MLQRVQSVYLAVAFIAALAVYFFPIAVFKADSGLITLNFSGFQNEEAGFISKFYPLAILTGIMCFFILFQVFNFKKRIRQIQTGKAVIILSLIWYLIVGIFVFNYFRTFDILLSARPGVALFLPIVVIILVIIANKYIRKDEELVRSIDRIR